MQLHMLHSKKFKMIEEVDSFLSEKVSNSSTVFYSRLAAMFFLAGTKLMILQNSAQFGGKRITSGPTANPLGWAGRRAG